MRRRSPGLTLPCMPAPAGSLADHHGQVWSGRRDFPTPTLILSLTPMHTAIARKVTPSISFVNMVILGVAGLPEHLFTYTTGATPLTIHTASDAFGIL